MASSWREKGVEYLFQWVGNTLTPKIARLEWTNVPTRWSDEIHRDLPFVPPGPREPLYAWGGHGSGLPSLGEAPRFQFSKKIGAAAPWDLTETYRSLLLLSSRVKDLLCGLDPAAFEVLEVAATHQDGSAAPNRWLADVVRFVDPLVYETSLYKEVDFAPYRRLHLSSFATTSFSRTEMGGAEIFRVPWQTEMWVFTERVRTALLASPRTTGGIVMPVGKLVD